MISCHSIAKALLERCKLHLVLGLVREGIIGGRGSIDTVVQICIENLQKTNVIVLILQGAAPLIVVGRSTNYLTNTGPPLIFLSASVKSQGP